MDKIRYRNPSKSEVISRCDGDEKKSGKNQCVCICRVLVIFIVIFVICSLPTQH